MLLTAVGAVALITLMVTLSVYVQPAVVVYVTLYFVVCAGDTEVLAVVCPLDHCTPVTPFTLSCVASPLHRVVAPLTDIDGLPLTEMVMLLDVLEQDSGLVYTT